DSLLLSSRQASLYVRVRTTLRGRDPSCFRVVDEFVLFFFQAEDGIRDATVTGVQTCALPILGAGVKWGAVQAAAGPHGLTGLARSEERRVGKSGDRGGGRVVKKKKHKRNEGDGRK